MKNYLFMPQVLSWLARPEFFNKAVAMILRIAAGIVVLLTLVTLFKTGKTTVDLPPAMMLGGILFQIAYIVAIYAVVHTILIRAHEVQNLPASPYPSCAVLSVLSRLSGEVYAAFVALTALGGGLFVWFTGRGLEKIWSPLPKYFPKLGDASFLGGLELMVGGIFCALGGLLAGYFVAEMLGLLARGRRSG